MKKFLHSLFLATVAAMLLASCSTQMSTVSIEKRHYNKGYFVQMNKKCKSESVPGDVKTYIAEPIRNEQVSTANNVSETVPPDEIPATGTIAVAKSKETLSKKLTASAVKHSVPGNLEHTFTPNTLKELKEIKAASKQLVSESKGNNNNNGLIWTIIVILLLLWILSLLTGGWGLGGLLYLFLVIAIVLIILKLLGVI